jgi:hypothetical protein
MALRDLNRFCKQIADVVSDLPFESNKPGFRERGRTKPLNVGLGASLNFFSGRNCANIRFSRFRRFILRRIGVLRLYCWIRQMRRIYVRWLDSAVGRNGEGLRELRSMAREYASIIPLLTRLKSGARSGEDLFNDSVKKRSPTVRLATKVATAPATPAQYPQL